MRSRGEEELKLSEGGGEQIERRILDAIAAAGEAGMLQHQLWRTLPIDSRKVSSVVRRLEKMGYIARVMTTQQGRKVYIIKPAPKLRQTYYIPLELEEVACFYCSLLFSCSGGLLRVNNCEKLEKWLLDSRAVDNCASA